MKIIRNIPNGFKLFRSVSIFNYYMKDIKAAKDAGEYEKEREIIAYSTNLWATKVTEIFGINVNITGYENIPKNKPCVFISNHQGYADIIVLFRALEGKQIGFIAKDGLKKVPYFGKWIQAIRGVFIKRGNARESLQAIKEGVELLKYGYSLVIFPEGTRSRGPKIGEFKAGSFKLATKSKVPIVPITINGSYHVYEERELIGGGDIDVMIHPPVYTDSLDRHQLANIHTTVENTIKKGLEQLLKDEK